MSELYYVLGICAGVLFMAWCIAGNRNTSCCVEADKPKRKDPRRFN